MLVSCHVLHGKESSVKPCCVRDIHAGYQCSRVSESTLCKSRFLGAAVFLGLFCLVVNIIRRAFSSRAA